MHTSAKAQQFSFVLTNSHLNMPDMMIHVLFPEKDSD